MASREAWGEAGTDCPVRPSEVIAVTGREAKTA